VAQAQAVEGDRALGEYLSSECVTCHQRSGGYDGIPPIVGWPPATFVEIMNEYRHKRRAHAAMQTIAGRLSEEELAALAAYFGSLGLPLKTP
jgi:cytochrome c